MTIQLNLVGTVNIVPTALAFHGSLRQHQSQHLTELMLIGLLNSKVHDSFCVKKQQKCAMQILACSLSLLRDFDIPQPIMKGQQNQLIYLTGATNVKKMEVKVYSK